jgi:SAM-dependent methyltransferase
VIDARTVLARLKRALGPERSRRLAGFLPRSVRAGARRLDSHKSYTDTELLARADEFNQNAETHWQSIAREPAGRAHVLNKPFSTVRDTPDILYRLGLVLSALEPGVGHTVLDFGAGSCWLAASLNRLRCRTVAIDVSPTALKLGEELFRIDPRHRLDLEPRFLPYDGHRIPLEPESVDRAACFDAFHHVPNQDEMLRELHRVLKPGGRAVLAEPGEGHSHMDQSLYETAMHGVLENDLHIGELAERARRAGFDEVLLKPYPDAAAMTVTAEEYLRLMDGDRGVFPFEALEASLRHFYVIILIKGNGRFDSRSPGLLAARIVAAEGQRALAGKAGAKLLLPVRVRNEGDTTWLHQKDVAGGYVALGGHLFDAERRLLARGFCRALLPRDVAPGEQIALELPLPLPERLGRYVVQLDMVDEFVAWFEQVGSKPLELELAVDRPRDSAEPGRLAATLRAQQALPSGAVKPGSRLALPLRLENTGDTLWLAGPVGERGAVCVGGHLVDAAGHLVAQDFFRVPLARPVAPGEVAEQACSFAAPRLPGRYRLRIDLVAVGVAWFEDHGGAPLELLVETSSETPDSLEPGLLRASIELREGGRSLEARVGSPLSVAVRVCNEGNTTWLHAPEPSRGHVALGGHLREASGALLEQDLFRVQLPRSVAPGTEVELACVFQAPSRAGRYRVELDMVDEGIAWFTSHGSNALTLELTVVD